MGKLVTLMFTSHVQECHRMCAVCCVTCALLYTLHFITSVVIIEMEWYGMLYGKNNVTFQHR